MRVLYNYNDSIKNIGKDTLADDDIYKKWKLNMVEPLGRKQLIQCGLELR